MQGASAQVSRQGVSDKAMPGAPSAEEGHLDFRVERHSQALSVLPLDSLQPVGKPALECGWRALTRKPRDRDKLF